MGDHPEVNQMWEDAHRRNAELIYKSIVALRGLWVKVGQFLSSRPDIVPLEYIKELSKLQDRIPDRPWDEVRRTLSRQLGRDWEERYFQHVEQRPLSCASIAQVHRAQRKNGQQVVIKVRHRDIKHKMSQDLGSLNKLTNMLVYFEPDQDYRKIVAEWTPAVRQELDLRNESKSLKLVGGQMKEAQIKVKIPEPVTELCTESVLVMEYVEGFSPKETSLLEEKGVDKELFMKRLCQCFGQQIHKNGFYHADPHPGNILVAEDSVPVLLDFGLTKTFEPEMKVAFSKLVYASYSQDLDQLEKSFVEMGLLIKREAQDPIRDLANMRRLFSPTPISKVKERRMELAREREKKRKEEEAKGKPKVKRPVDAWPSELVFFVRVTGLLKGLCSQFDLDFPYLEVMAASAKATVMDSVPKEERAAALIYPGVTGSDVDLQRRLEKIVGEKREDIVGIQVAVCKDNELVADLAAGTLSAANPRSVTPHSLFNVFSVTKAFLATSIHLLVERGVIELEEKVCTYWPEFAAGGKEDITVAMLLSHACGLSSAMPTDLDEMLHWDSMLEFIAKEKPDSKTLGCFSYHAISYCWLIGGLVEGATGTPFSTFVKTEILEPLGIQDEVFFGVPECILSSKPDSLVSVSNPVQLRDAGTRQDQGSIFRTNPTVFNLDKVRKACLPSANAHMNARSIVKFYSSFFSEGGLLSQKTKDLILSQAKSVTTAANPTENSTYSRKHSLGYQIFSFKQADTGTLIPVVGHLGFGGSVGFITQGLHQEKVSVGITVSALDFRTQESTSAALVKEIGDYFGLEPQF